jgi:PIN domain nuclease of toxin-antitoxin system
VEPAYLLDASALIALIRNEPGADRVKTVLDYSAIHAVNLAEVVRKTICQGMPATEVHALLEDLNLAVIEELGQAQAYAVGQLAAQNPRAGLSLGDSVCLMAAEWMGLTAVTADRRWSDLPGRDVKILQIR